MTEDTLRTLEYEKIRAMLAAEAGSFIGRERAEALSPSSDFEEAAARLEETAEARGVLASASPPLGGIRDIRPLLKKVSLDAALELDELSEVRSVLYAAREVKRFFRERADGGAPGLAERARRLEILGQLERDLENAIDEHGALRDDASLALAKLRRDIRANQQRIKDMMAAFVHSPATQKFLQEAIVTIREDRYVIPVRQEYRRAVPGIVHDQSATGATLFIEPMEAVALNNDIKALALAERQETARILRALSADVRKHGAALAANLDLLAGLDFAFAKARLAERMRAVRPELNREGRARLFAARHPLIAADSVVPIDLTLGASFRMLLVTGPNTGGKTVGMKTLGLLALMAQSGLFIPAGAGSELPVYRGVYTDIGDEQSIEQSLSTFSSHMRRVVRILEAAGADDLLLLDELGAGTDPEEGAALATAILERLCEAGVSVVATTHYAALKAFAHTRDGVENACVEFDARTLRPTYRLLIGVPGASNAFAISRRLGLSPSLIERARALVGAGHARFEEVVRALELEKAACARKSAELDARRAEARAIEEQWTRLRDEMTKKKTDILRQAKSEGAALLRRTRREAESIIEGLKAQAKAEDEKERQRAIEAARGGLRALAADVRPVFASDPAYRERADAAKLAPGDTVYVAPLAQKGDVLEVRGGSIVVQLGGMRTTVRADACRFVSHAPRAKAADATGVLAASAALLSKAASVRRELDIRGALVDEGEQRVGKFLDDAALAGLRDVLIIHGKGTGALRKGVHAYLARHKNVRSFAFADMEEGGLGATVVHLR